MTTASQLYQLLSKGRTGNQRRLVELLKEQGYVTTQSSVSRALKKINAVKGQDENGNAVYSLPKPASDPRQPDFFDSLVYKIENNGQLVVVHTRPGTANTVAKFIDDHNLAAVMGSVAGDDTIVIVPSDPARTRQTQKILEAYLRRIGIF